MLTRLRAGSFAFAFVEELVELWDARSRPRPGEMACTRMAEFGGHIADRALQRRLGYAP